jgi:anti-anti-sigma factor
MHEENYKIVVDLSKVDYMSSVGAGIFIAVHGIAIKNKGAVVLVNPKAKIRQIFKMLGMAQILLFTDTLKNAFKLIEKHRIVK